MTDQFGEEHAIADLRGRVIVLVYGDRKSADANRALGEWLHVAFHPTAQGQPPKVAKLAPVKPLEGHTSERPGPEVVAVPVAVVGKVPGIVAGIIRRQIRCGSPEVPIWLDLQDDMRELFGVKPGVSNVAVIDCQGRLRYTATGPLPSDQQMQLARVIEGLRRECASER